VLREVGCEQYESLLSGTIRPTLAFTARRGRMFASGRRKRSQAM